MAFSDLLKAAAKHAGVEYSQTAISKSLSTGDRSVSKQTVDRWFNDGTPDAGLLFHIADTWKVSARWLATGEGSMAQHVVMEPGAEYRALSQQALEVARGFDQLPPDCQEHVSRQVELLRRGQVVDDSGRRRAVQHDVRIKRGSLRPDGSAGKRKKGVR